MATMRPFVPLSQLLSLPGARALRAPTMPRGKESPKDAGKAG